MHTEEELREIFTSLLSKYSINLQIDPQAWQIQSPAAIDVEHNEEGEMVGVGIYDGEKAYYFTKLKKGLLSDFPKASWIAHNGLSDFELLRQWGVPVFNEQLVHDTMLVGHIIDSSLKAYGLKDMAKRELGIEYPDYSDLVGKKSAKERKTLDKWPVDIVAMYCVMDCYATYKLYERQMECIAH